MEVASSTTFEQYIQKFLPTFDYVPEKTFIFTFLLSSRLHILPQKLMQHLENVLEHLPASYESRSNLLNNVVFILREWTRNFPYDFLTPAMLHALKDICLKMHEIHSEVKPELDLLTGILDKKLASLWDYEKRVHKYHQVVLESLNYHPRQDTMIDICPDYRKLVQNLIHIELDAMRHIGLEAFIHASVKHSEVKWKNETNLHTLEYYANLFNRQTRLVATEVCRFMKLKKRVQVVDYYIDVATESYNLGNFNSAMAIISGLNMTQVTRLKKTWEKISNYSKFEHLEQLMNPSRNFFTYRTKLKEALDRAESATCLNQKVVIPFFSLFLKDVFFLKESRQFMNQKNYDIEVFWSLAKMLVEFDNWKATTCPYDPDANVLDYVHGVPLFSDQAMDLASFLLEPPETRQEKSYQKQLR